MNPIQIPLILPYFNVLEMSNFTIREHVHHSAFPFFFLNGL